MRYSFPFPISSLFRTITLFAFSIQFVGFLFFTFSCDPTRGCVFFFLFSTSGRIKWHLLCGEEEGVQEVRLWKEREAKWLPQKELGSRCRMILMTMETAVAMTDFDRLRSKLIGSMRA